VSKQGLDDLRALALVEEFGSEGVPQAMENETLVSEPADPGGASSVAFWRGERSLEGMSVCYWDAWERARPGEAGHTFMPRNPLVSENKPAPGRDRRMDYLLGRCEDSLYGPTLEISSCRLAFDEPVDGVWGSDHFGVVAELSAQTSGGRPVG
jgi:hypothetical protein